MEAVAIIGASCRFPGAPDMPAFWRLLHDGVDAITEVPADRWDAAAFYDPNPKAAGKTSTRWGGFLPDVDRFDAAFFGISPVEAERMDPQQRLVLEVAWEALEDAGVPADGLAGSRTGVFVGISHSDYDRIIYRDRSRLSAFNGTGSYHAIAANRLSFVLDLRGPSMAVDTACSSSLIALHLACQSLHLHESSLAIVGGVNLNLTPDETIALSRARAMAADGRCKTFDARADGYVRGEGCGVVVLKRLADAVRDGDRVRACIRGTAVNQDGLSNGLTAPNGLAQEAVIREALRNAGVQPAAIGCVEAHGTGTPLGDPVEMRALKAVLLEGRTARQPCWIGSVKTNIGHLEAAGGMAGLLKTVLALEHGEIPAHLHLRQFNRLIALEGTPLAVPLERQPWPRSATPRLAGVSAFGIGGTNGHAVVEEAPPPPPRPGLPARGPHVLAVSAKTEAALRALAGLYADTVAAGGDAALPDVCFSGNTGRARMEHRLAIVGDAAAPVAAGLRAFAEGREVAGLLRGKRRAGVKVAFLFAGESAPWSDLPGTLSADCPVFRTALDDCAARLPHPLVLPAVDRSGAPGSDRVAAHLGLAATEYALAALWRSWGVHPAAVAGCGVGEFVAACIAGVIGLDDALRLVAARARHLAGDAEAEDDHPVVLHAPTMPVIPWHGGAFRPEALTASRHWRADDGRPAGLAGAGFDIGLDLGPEPDRRALAASLATLFTQGVALDWAAVDRRVPRPLVPLPHYPFQRLRHWLDG